MEYDIRTIEGKARAFWKEKDIYKVSHLSDKPKYYVLDMFPYPSGAGLHVGHPLGYIASDIFSRYKRLKGFNVLHPMGFDAFGLPAEQYAIETGQHPSVTTEKNIQRYREQLDNIGFCYDWSREVRTSDPKYYKWTQWIFLQLFNSWFNRSSNKAEKIDTLIAIFEQEGNAAHACPGEEGLQFTAADWKAMNETEQRRILMEYRLAYLAHAEVNWCEALGTVLANDEVINGLSERGGHPVVKKKMSQWFLRITEYADRLLSSLDTLEWTESMKEMQRNWIGKSQGAEIDFVLQTEKNEIPALKVFTTRPDTIFGVSFMVVAPDHEMVPAITSAAQKAEVDAYVQYVQSRSERERQADVKQITGCFTGAYAVHPFTGDPIPVWISEYVLAGYGTGAIMAVPAGDDRDHAFATHFKLPIPAIFEGQDTDTAAYTEKAGKLAHSGLLNGLEVKQAQETILAEIEKMEIGHRKVNFRLRDAGFSRQRYWGEPFPIVYKNGVAYELPVSELPVELPHVDTYSPGPEGQGPLANITDWVNLDDHTVRETNTMPGYAGSSWYFLRYMDPHNDNELVGADAVKYWNQVDVYIGGTEHAVGHLLYSRMWTKALFDFGIIPFEEPFKRLVNQGMIVGTSQKIWRYQGIVDGELAMNSLPQGIRELLGGGYEFDFENGKDHLIWLSNELVQQNPWLKDNCKPINVPISLVIEDKEQNVFELDVAALVEENPIRYNGVYVTSNAIWDNYTWYASDYGVAHFPHRFTTFPEIEKMSKSKVNVVNPDDMVERYGADAFRMYEMFLGPIDVSKPWDTKGIEGVSRFLKKFWRLFTGEDNGWQVTDAAPTPEELKVLHKTIKKIDGDTNSFAYNTAVSQFMICVNELTALKCSKKAILQELVVLIAPYAPHMAEALWMQLGMEGSVLDAAYPVCNEAYLVESSKVYPVAVNGKPRAEMEFALDADQASVEAAVLANEQVQRWLDGGTPKKIIYVKGKMINVVV